MNIINSLALIGVFTIVFWRLLVCLPNEEQLWYSNGCRTRASWKCGKNENGCVPNISESYCNFGLSPYSIVASTSIQRIGIGFLILGLLDARNPYFDGLCTNSLLDQCINPDFHSACDHTFQMDALFKVCDALENLCNGREIATDSKWFLNSYEIMIHTLILELESSRSFKETNALVEKCTSLLFLVMVKITPILVIAPTSAASLFSYFTTESSVARNDALQLPLPMWQIKQKFWPHRFHRSIKIIFKLMMISSFFQILWSSFLKCWRPYVCCCCKR